MKLKKATPKDIIDLKKICIEAYSLNFYDHWNTGGFEWYLDKEFSTEKLLLDLTDIITDYYFIQHKSQTVGFIKIRNKSYSDLQIENTIELQKIYVLPEYKGFGIGKLALKEIIQIAQEQGKKHIVLDVIDTNKNAIAFYEKLGFYFHSKTTLDIPYFKEELKGMNVMVKELNQ